MLFYTCNLCEKYISSNVRLITPVYPQVIEIAKPLAIILIKLLLDKLSNPELKSEKILGRNQQSYKSLSKRLKDSVNTVKRSRIRVKFECEYKTCTILQDFSTKITSESKVCNKV